MQSQRLLARLADLGPFSLLASFAGGALLIFVGANSLASKDQEFVIWSHLGLQTWLAIIGVGVGLLSYGYNETYHHCFDWWCTRQALQKSGLNYAKYLNAQSRAPVAHGFRGFPQFVLLRYLVVLLSVTASIGYKFGLVEKVILIEKPTGSVSGDTNPQEKDPGMTRVLDTPFSRGSERFVHRSSHAMDWDHKDDVGFETFLDFLTTPPSSVILFGEPSTPRFMQTDEKYITGHLTDEELVLVANATQEGGDFRMTSDRDGWHRIKVDNWTLNKTGIVDYRAAKPGVMQIQWAPSGEWYDDPASKMSQAVESRVTYSFRYAMAETTRLANIGGSFRGLVSNDHIRILSLAKEPVPLDFEISATTQAWIALLMSYPFAPTHRGSAATKNFGSDSSRSQDVPMPMLLNGMSAIVRAVMAGLPDRHCTAVFLREGNSCITSSEYFEPLTDDQHPLGSKAERIATLSMPASSYPFYSGSYSGGTGCRLEAAILFIIVGAVSMLLTLMRVYVGPPQLTSWMGQHTYLASIGAIPLSEVKHLATGYKACNNNIGKLYLKEHDNEDDGMAWQDKNRDSLSQ